MILKVAFVYDDLVDITISSEKLKENLDEVLSQVSNGKTVLANDKNNNALSLFVEPKFYKKIFSDSSEIEKKNIRLENRLKNLLNAKKPKLQSKANLNESQKSLLKIKSKLPFFLNCSDMELISVVENVKILKLGPEEKVFLENETTDSIYYIVSGNIDIIKHIQNSNNSKIVGKLSPKDVFGEMAYLTKKPRAATAKVSKNSSSILIHFNIKAKIPASLEFIYMKVYHNFALELSKKLDRTNQA